MNIYSLYEFPPTNEVLEGILNYIDVNQPVLMTGLKEYAGVFLGKRPSRTSITIKELKKIGLIEGDKEVRLTWETQLYIDLKRPIKDLVIYLTYRLPELFNICNDICEIDPELNLSKPKLLEVLYDLGYQQEKLSTNREKLHGLIRLIKICQTPHNKNPFKTYSYFVIWLEKMQTFYLSLSNNRFDENIAIAEIKSEMLKGDLIKSNEFEAMLNKLYSDPILSSFTSFSSVGNNFSEKGYVELSGNKFYYLKIKQSLVIGGNLR